ncbi:MAG: serine--tRNA ligase [Chloroflexi bacterium]|nr:serine--tRNA ligase [Chloroflexota bacterium]
MISIELIRNDPVKVRDAMSRRGEDVPIDQILELDTRRRATISQADELRSRRNTVSRELGHGKERPPELIEEMREVGAKIRTLEETIRSVDEEINSLLLNIPNLPQDDVPLGEDETDNVVVKTVGEIPSFDFEPLPHWELGEKLDIIDFERGVKLAGSRFFVLKGKGARLQRALISWMIDKHSLEHGYDELYLPYMLTRESAIANSNLPKYADTMYHDEEDDLWMLPTAEMGITNLHRDEILAPDTLPVHYVAHTPCFRREKAAAGRDTRGIKRVHQFEKVEMYQFVKPEQSNEALEQLISHAENICTGLGLPYRLLQLCTADLGFQSSKTFDLEAWAAGCREWLEVSSCSNCTDFQARRASIRYRPEAGARPRFVHTINGSGLALPRTMIAILENYQQADGTVAVPEVLRRYTAFDVID